MHKKIFNEVNEKLGTISVREVNPNDMGSEKSGRKERGGIFSILSSSSLPIVQRLAGKVGN